mmetsp:Transcript_28766/g.82338  ORF Transcript_28766/g.82338 Transcript_28766/m.82338 type:complete len:258 (-) Transcript_28766:405-1178(-)
MRSRSMGVGTRCEAPLTSLNRRFLSFLCASLDSVANSLRRSKARWHLRAFLTVSFTASSVSSGSEASCCMQWTTPAYMPAMAFFCSSASRLLCKSARESCEGAFARSSEGWLMRASRVAPRAAAMTTDIGHRKTASDRTAICSTRLSARASASRQPSSCSAASDAGRLARSSSASMPSAVCGFGSTSSPKPRPSSSGSSKRTTLAFSDSSALRSAAASSLSSVISWTSSTLQAACTHANIKGRGSNSIGDRTAKNRR